MSLVASPAWLSETHARYAAGGLAGRLPAGRSPAVLVIDLQLGFTDPAHAPGSNLDGEVAATRGLLDGAREHGLPVLFTAIAFTPAQIESLVWLRKMPAMRELIDGERSTELDPRLGRRPEEPLLVKQAASGFHATDLERRLRASGADCLIVCGATTSGCVRATVVDACAANWPTFVPREAVGDRAEGPHEASLLDMDAKYADVIELERAERLLAGVRAG